MSDIIVDFDYNIDFDRSYPYASNYPPKKPVLSYDKKFWACPTCGLCLRRIDLEKEFCDQCGQPLECEGLL